MYYLNSRYYNPQIGRFLNTDGLLGENGDILSTNMYAYCANNPVMYSDITGYVPEWLVGIGRIASGVLAVAAAIAVIASGVALAPMLIVAAITLTAGGLTIANGIADIQQSITGDNFVRDSVFNGNQESYNLYAGITEGIAIVGSMICGGWLKYNAPRIQAYKNVGSYDFSGTLSKADHMARPWQNSIMAQRNVIKYGSMINEAGSRYKFIHEGWKLVVNISEELILHFGPF